jgi:hypothetical protein
MEMALQTFLAALETLEFGVTHSTRRQTIVALLHNAALNLEQAKMQPSADGDDFQIDPSIF